MNRPVLLLGASGLLGHNVLELLLAKGVCVRVILRPGSRLLPMQEGTDCFHGKLETRTGDILSRSCIDECVRGCGAIINCAGTTDMSLLRLEDYLPVNFNLPCMLCEVLDSSAADCLVHVSTANTVGPGYPGRPSDESTEFAPPFTRSFYALSKKMSEDRLIAYAGSHPDKRVVILNPGFMVGPYDAKPSSGKLLLAAYRRRIMAAPCGEGKSFVHVRAAAAAVANALESGRSGERYLLCGESMSLRDFYSLQARLCGYDQIFLSLPRGLCRLAARAGDLLQWLGFRTMLCTRNMDQLLTSEWYDSSRARRELDMPDIPVEQAITDFFSYYDKKCNF